MNYKAFHTLSYGIYIISSEHEGKKSGYIGNTVFQVTSDPPKIAISCHKENFTTGIIRQSRLFSVSVLAKELPVSLIGEFGFMSGSEIDKFSRVRYKYSSNGMPVIIQDSVAWFACKVSEEVDCGSHILFIAEVTDSEILSTGEPLTYEYYREKYRMLAPKNAPTYLAGEKIATSEQSNFREEALPPLPKAEDSGMKTFTCSICGFTYEPEEGDPSIGIPPGTPFSELLDNYKCPICNAGKDYFR